MLDKGGCAVQMHPTLAALCYGQVLQDRRLQRGAEPLRSFDAIVFGRGL
jgi:hypothetical protein